MNPSDFDFKSLYLKHFGVTEFPFSITPDTSFFFSSGGAQEALNTLLIAVRTGEGFIKITGEVGTGKTLLCRKLMMNLQRDFMVAYIPNPYLEPRALFMELASELGANVGSGPNLEQHELLKSLTKRVMDIIREGRRVVICLDEAQAMPIETLEALRLLTNLETEKRKLLQVIIFGQPELEEKLDHPSIRQLKQRITFDYLLSPLSGEELEYYLHHRLGVAGYQGGRLFSRMAVWMLEQRTKRVPRLVNILAHKAMLSAFGKGKRIVGWTDVLAAADDTASLRRTRWMPDLKFALLLIVGCGMGWVYLQ